MTWPMTYPGDAVDDVDETAADGWSLEWADPVFRGGWGNVMSRRDLLSPLSVEATRNRDGATLTLSPSAHGHLMRLSGVVDLAERAVTRADRRNAARAMRDAYEDAWGYVSGSGIFSRWSDRFTAMFLNALVRFPDDLRQTVLRVADAESSDPPCQVLWNVFKAAVAEERRRRRASGPRTSKSATVTSTSA